MMLNLVTIEIRLENDVVLARQKARSIAAALKFDAQDQTRIATAVSEIARNTFQYGGGGQVEFQISGDPENLLMITLRDKGRGIQNLQQVMDGKYVSQTGMGQGIIGAKRLMDDFQIETGPDRGTEVRLVKKLPRRMPRLEKHELNDVLSSIERISRDPYEELKQQNRELLSTLQELRDRQEELAQLNRELDDTNRGVVALYAELNDKADFLQRASELKSHFLSNMSHEFRTPLNSITALSQILLDRLDGELTAEQEKQVKYIRSSALDLAEIVNDLLDLAKVEAGKVTLRPKRFEVSGLFAALRGMLRPLLSQNSSVNLIFEDPVDIPELYSDEAKISQILRNFISNALKFTERGEVRVSASLGHDDTVILSVADTGIGIDVADQERIFEEWAQVEGQLQKSVKGSGLGLPLSRKFAQLLGGDVYVKSETGKGATFCAAIPINFSGQTEAIYVPDARRDLDATRLPILVVDDNKEALFIYEKYLKGTRFQIVPATSLKEARRALREFRPSAVILDVLLQGEHSWDLLQEIKLDPAMNAISVFVVTVIDNREKALALGADGFHPKPIERNWLIRELERACTQPTKRLLIVDDDEVSRYLVRTILGTHDFAIAEAASGQEGLQRAIEERPDMVVLDLMMPDMSGYEVLSRLKADQRTAGIPVIIHTSKTLDARDRDLLRDATAIVSKESQSKELVLERFSEAFRKAGFPLTLKSGKEVQHV